MRINFYKKEEKNRLLSDFFVTRQGCVVLVITSAAAAAAVEIRQVLRCHRAKKVTVRSVLKKKEMGLFVVYFRN